MDSLLDGVQVGQALLQVLIVIIDLGFLEPGLGLQIPDGLLESEDFSTTTRTV